MWRTCSHSEVLRRHCTSSLKTSLEDTANISYKFDDLRGSRVLEGLNPVPTPYNGLAYPGWSVFDTSAGLTNVKPDNPPNFATSATFFQMNRLGQTSSITTDGTTTKSFDLLTVFNACQNIEAEAKVYREVGCTIEYTGVKTNGEQVPPFRCTFKATGSFGAPRTGTLCTLPKGFTGLKSVNFDLAEVNTWFYGKAVIIIDNVVGKTYS